MIAEKQKAVRENTYAEMHTAMADVYVAESRTAISTVMHMSRVRVNASCTRHMYAMAVWIERTAQRTDTCTLPSLRMQLLREGEANPDKAAI